MLRTISWSLFGLTVLAMEHQRQRDRIHKWTYCDSHEGVELLEIMSLGESKLSVNQHQNHITFSSCSYILKEVTSDRAILYHAVKLSTFLWKLLHGWMLESYSRYYVCRRVRDRVTAGLYSAPMLNTVRITVKHAIKACTHFWMSDPCQIVGIRSAVRFTVFCRCMLIVDVEEQPTLHTRFGWTRLVNKAVCIYLRRAEGLYFAL